MGHALSMVPPRPLSVCLAPHPPLSATAHLNLTTNSRRMGCQLDFELIASLPRRLFSLSPLFSLLSSLFHYFPFFSFTFSFTFHNP